MMKHLISGDTFSYVLTNPEYPASRTTGTLHLGHLQASGVANASGQLEFTINPESTRTLVAGIYQASVRIYQDGVTKTIQQWSVYVSSNPALTPVVNVAFRMVELIDKALMNQLADGEAVESLSLSGRSISFMSRTELLEERAIWIRHIERQVTGTSGITTIPLKVSRF